MFYHFKIHKETKGYWAECIELDGCYTQAQNIKDLRIKMKEALDLFLSEPEKSNHLFAMPLKKAPKYKGRSVEKVHVDPSVAFSMLIRQTRIKKSLTLREMASILNYKNINTYVKLEKAKTCNPQLRTLANIKQQFSNFPMALIF